MSSRHDDAGLTRRGLIGGTVAAGALPAALRAQAATARTRLILLGTKGGPTPSALRAPPASLVLIDGKAHVIDCGNGVANQLAKAGVALTDLAAIYLTHHHSDHVADLVTLPLVAWASGLATPVDLYGPPPIERTVALMLEAYATDIAIRGEEEGRPPLADQLRVHAIAAAGTLVDRPGLRVTCAKVDHYRIPAWAYRFDTPDRSIVFSGDTRPSPALVELARGADVLVHEAMYLPAVRRIAEANAPTLTEHLLRSHSTAEQAGEAAAAAGVKTLVLSHLVPASPEIGDTTWAAAARSRFGGEVIVGRDLAEI